jgi:hypothetical protein
MNAGMREYLKSAMSMAGVCKAYRLQNYNSSLSSFLHSKLIINF